MYSFFGIPDICAAEEPITVKQIISNSDLKKNQYLFIGVEKITWIYRIKDIVKPYSDDKREYLEIEVIEVVVNSDKHGESIVNSIMNCIPYPLVVILRMKNAFRIFVSHIHIDEGNQTKVIVDGIIGTEWLSEKDKNLESLKMNMAAENIYEMYSELFNKIIDIILLNELPERLGDSLSYNFIAEKRSKKQILDEIRQIDQEIISCRNALRSEDHFNRQMELNNKIKILQEDRRKIFDVPLFSENKIN